MKLSRYIILFDNNNIEFYIYNTLTNALIEIDEFSYSYLNRKKTDKTDILETDIDIELYNLLENKKYIVENDFDNFLYYKSKVTQQRASQSHMHLTIAPTMDCCFRCDYCFEEHKEKIYMNDEVIDSIIKYLNSIPSKPEINLTWFGGEPLMAISQMEKLYTKLIDKYKEPTFSDIITTGYHINEDVISVMKKLKIKQVQITLDGKKDTHNKVKNLVDCKDVFSKVLDNVELLLRTSDIHVVFRVNLTKQNAHEYVELYYYLIERFKYYKNKGISPGFVKNRGACNNNDRMFFSTKEASEFILNLWNKHQIHSPFLRYPSNSFNECAIKNVMSVSFDPQGYAYKCWEVIGNKKYAIGNLDKEGRMININKTTLNRHLYGADPLENPVCSKCKYLPLCSGGCPIQRLENMYEGRKNNCCTFYKGKMKEYLRIHLKLKELGVQNKA